MQGEADINEVCKKFNLEEGLIKNLSKSQQSAKTFLGVIEAAGVKQGEKKIGNMLYSVTTKLPVIVQKYREMLAQEIGKGRISNPNQLDYAIDYLVKQQKKGGVDIQAFQKDCGVGVILTQQDITKIVNEAISDANENSSIFTYMSQVKTKIPYVEGKVLKQIMERQWKAKGLPQKPVNAEKKGDKKKNDKKVEKKGEQQEQVFHIKDISELIGRQMNSAVNSKQNLQNRNKQFGEGILTRFPPEPNGYLHIGHCKAMRFNFMQAKITKGNCYLRFDDTNPLKQNQEFIDNIQENIHWMGYKPWKVTHASDNFDRLFQLAVQLIKQGDAFVCSESKQQVKKKRSEGKPSKDRDRSVQDNLKLFMEMKMGLYEQNQYSLRAKIDCNHPNTTLRDPVIYRIRFTSHPHVGDKWCVYPLYDFTHCICDSLQGISHSLCSLEFEIRRELYYWVLEKLNLYRPNVWQYSRLNITNTVMSKRTLHKLIFDKWVDGWDDPRILTINGMRRRGYPAEAINNFCDIVGVTRRGNENYIHFGVLENEVRKYLDVNAPRTMAVIDPVELYIDGIEEELIEVPLFPKNQEKGKRKVRLTKKIYVDREDIKLKDEKGYYGIAPNKVVGLKYVSSIFIKEIKSQNGEIISVHAEIDKEKRKPSSYLNWISADESFDCQVRIYGLLFTVEKPADHANFLDFLNKNSKINYKNSKCHTDLLNNLNILDRVQFQRKGFFAVDLDSDIANKKIIWNHIVSLQQDKGKK